MADDRADDRDAEIDIIELPEDPLYIDRAPIAAVSVQGGGIAGESLHVICTDGACFKLSVTGAWWELEPVPGTERAAMKEAEEPSDD